MKITGLMPARNEQWCLGLSARVALMWCDELVVLDHASTDDTPDILQAVSREHPGRLTVLTETDPTWAEMAHRQRLLEAARERGATHCAIIDADEVLTGTLLKQLPRMFGTLARRGRCISVPMFNMHRGLTQYRSDSSIWSRRTATVGFADMPALCWQSVNGYDFHHREPYNSIPGPRAICAPSVGGVMHLQFADWRRLTAKHALYKMQEVIRWPGRKAVAKVDQMYSLALDETVCATQPAPAEWWVPYAHLMKHYHQNEEPWQERVCRELWAQHGPEKFAGLNLFGIEKGELWQTSQMCR
jgi:hypothetical protein